MTSTSEHDQMMTEAGVTEDDRLDVEAMTGMDFDEWLAWRTGRGDVDIRLDRGGHDGPDSGHCLLEVVSMFAKEPFGDSPKCVSPYLRSFGIRLNDIASDEQRQDLRRFIPMLPGTAGDGLDERRRWLAADHVIRVSAPRWLDAAGLTGHAATLRALAPITDRGSWRASQVKVRAARDAAYQLRSEKLGGSLYGVVYRDAKKAVREALAKQKGTAAAVHDAATAAAAVAVVVDDLHCNLARSGLVESPAHCAVQTAPRAFVDVRS